MAPWGLTDQHPHFNRTRDNLLPGSTRMVATTHDERIGNRAGNHGLRIQKFPPLAGAADHHIEAADHADSVSRTTPVKGESGIVDVWRFAGALTKAPAVSATKLCQDVI